MAVKTIDRLGRIQTSYLSGGPATAPGMGCGPYGCPGMGAVPAVRRGSMDQAAAISLASGAFSGARAAKYALEGFQQSANRAGMGSVTVTAPGFAFDNVSMQTIAVDSSIPVGSDVSSQYLNAATGTEAGPASSGSSSGSSTTVAQDIGTGITLAGLLAGTGLNVYGQVSGKPAVVQVAAKPNVANATTGLSTGAMVGIGVGGLVLLLGVLALSSGGRRSAPASSTPTVIRANGKRFVRASGNCYVRSNAKVCRPSRYAHLLKRAV